ncbi:nuclear transport factor 2 family protein [Solimonas terrae]|uniref:Nuclear transport factor 2 family protein n=1 Tax=Solimonas terrae TaxID=1396819 RepID=A0A6M2BVA5_9GAMM|nr:nuclear transport factor 2 family protein [Solimonas terrae]NGY05919.1 nuclear transport factor 2 family protein [Solimonas terrae]
MEAKAEIAEVVNNWTFFRDQEAWSSLLGTFHEDGTISLSWYQGPFKGFVAASENASKGKNAIVKHYVGIPMIQVNGDRALSETNVTIMLRAKTPAGEVDTTSYARFFDLVERRNGSWKILKRTAIYERDRLDPVQGPLPDVFYKGLEQYPEELRFLASSLHKLGIEISPATVVDKSPALAELYRGGSDWLLGS